MAAEAWLEKFPASYIGLTAAVTYPGNKSLREVVRRMPLDKLLLETDAPYFLPAQVGCSTVHVRNCYCIITGYSLFVKVQENHKCGFTTESL